MTTNADRKSVILQLKCRLKERLAASITDFIYSHTGKIIYHDQYVDSDQINYFSRIEWLSEGFNLSQDEIQAAFTEFILQKGFDMEWNIHYSEQLFRMAIFVSKKASCLYDILARHQSGQWNVEIPVIVSNHKDLEYVARQFNIPFHYFPITAETKTVVEKAQIDLLKQHNIDFVVMARYMQILSDDFVREYPSKIINIHHAFLPAFPGAKPYHQAHARGVKLIGATSHYATASLDQGPIIEQDVAQVSHRDSVDDLVRKGNDLEVMVLSRAIYKHLQRKIMVHDNKTVVFF